jgi:DNA-binding beta-propeller fold protein YncE
VALAPELVVVNQPERTVQVVATDTGTVRLSVVAGERPHEVEISPDGRRAVLPIYGSGGVGQPGTDGSTIEILDLESGKTSVASLGAGVRPHDARFGGDGLLYVTAELRNAVLVVDPDRLRVVGEIPTGQEQSHSLAIDRRHHRAFTSNVSSGSVSVLDLKARRLLGVVKAAGTVQRITVAPNGRRVFTHDQRRPQVIAIDPGRLAVSETYPLPGLAYASAVARDGKRLIVGGRPEASPADQRAPSLYIVDLKSKAVQMITLPGWPRVIIAGRKPDEVWASLGSGELVSIDLDDRTYRIVAKLKPGLDGMALRDR